MYDVPGIDGAAIIRELLLQNVLQIAAVCTVVVDAGRELQFSANTDLQLQVCQVCTLRLQPFYLCRTLQHGMQGIQHDLWLRSFNYPNNNKNHTHTHTHTCLLYTSDAADER